MKPRTKLQHKVVGLAQHLPCIKNKMLSWAKVECLYHKGYATKTRVVCMDCGGRFSPDLVKRKKAVCPHCNTKLVVEQSRKRTDEQRVYVAYAETIEEFQVIRNFELFAYYKADEAPRYYLYEILQHWVLSNGKYESYGRNHTTNWYCDSWNGYMEIRKNYSRYYQSSNKYDVYPYKYYPKSKFKPEYKLYGINEKLEGLTFLEAIRILPKNPTAETLLKAKQYALLGFCNGYGGRISSYWPSIKICLRNKYNVKDATQWFDYLDLLRYFKKDLHNAHYVCPKDFKKEHNKYVKRKKRIMDYQEMQSNYIHLLKHFGEYQEKDFVFPKNLKREYKILVDREKIEKLEKEKKKLEGMALKYQQFIQPFLDIQISDKLIEIIPLKSIEDFKHEGEVLEHCVYSNKYFERENSLILSAKINGVSIETIEIDIKSMRIIQSRGFDNDPTKYHDSILKLMNRNMHLIKERLNPKKNGTKKDVNRISQTVDIAV